MSPVKMSKIESGIRAVLDYVKALNQHDVPGMVQLIHEDCVLENAFPAPDGATYTGKEEIAQYWLEFFSKSPDAQIKVEDAYGFGEPCIMRWRYIWTDAAGNEQYIRGVDIFKVEEGLICEILSYVKGNWHNLG